MNDGAPNTPPGRIRVGAFAAVMFAAAAGPALAQDGPRKGPAGAPAAIAQPTMESIAAEGVDLVVLYGLATPGQKNSARTAARTALAALGPPPADDADRAIDAATIFARARALVVAAAAEDNEPDRRRHADAAVELLAGWTVDSPVAEGARRVTRGAALLLRNGRADPARALTEFGAAEAGLQGVPDAAAVLAEAIIGGACAKAAAGDPPGAVEGLRSAVVREPFFGARGPDVLLVVVATDAAARILRGPPGRPDAAGLAAAVAEESRLLERFAGLIDSAGLKSMVYARIAILTEGLAEADLAALPPEAMLARGLSLARNPKAAPDAVRVLDLAARAESAPVRADAMWELGSILAGEGPASDSLKAADILARFAREFPSDVRAGDAVAAAAAAARTAMAKPGLDTSHAASARAALLAALDVGIDHLPSRPEHDFWVCERARLALEDADGAPDGGESQRATAIRLLETVRPGSPAGAEAGSIFERAAGPVFDKAMSGMEDARRRSDEKGVQSLAAALAPAARRAADWTAARGAPGADRFLADWADAVTETGSGEAAGSFRAILSRGAAIPGGEVRARLGLGRSLLNAGDAADGFATLKDLVARLEAAAGRSGTPASRPREFWHAWTLLLETLAAQNTDGSRSAAIRAQAARLRAIDAGLGGEPWKGRIEAARARADK